MQSFYSVLCLSFLLSIDKCNARLLFLFARWADCLSKASKIDIFIELPLFLLCRQSTVILLFSTVCKQLLLVALPLTKRMRCWQIQAPLEQFSIHESYAQKAGTTSKLIGRKRYFAYRYKRVRHLFPHQSLFSPSYEICWRPTQIANEVWLIYIYYAIYVDSIHWETKGTTSMNSREAPCKIAIVGRGRFRRHRCASSKRWVTKVLGGSHWQGRTDHIHVLPATPQNWPQSNLRGLLLYWHKVGRVRSLWIRCRLLGSSARVQWRRKGRNYCYDNEAHEIGSSVCPSKRTLSWEPDVPDEKISIIMKLLVLYVLDVFPDG